MVHLQGLVVAVVGLVRDSMESHGGLFRHPWVLVGYEHNPFVLMMLHRKRGYPVEWCQHSILVVPLGDQVSLVYSLSIEGDIELDMMPMRVSEHQLDYIPLSIIEGTNKLNLLVAAIIKNIPFISKFKFNGTY